MQRYNELCNEFLHRLIFTDVYTNVYRDSSRNEFRFDDLVKKCIPLCPISVCIILDIEIAEDEYHLGWKLLTPRGMGAVILTVESARRYLIKPS